jgi:hypothetical protein
VPGPPTSPTHVLPIHPPKHRSSPFQHANAHSTANVPHPLCPPSCATL